MVEQYAGAGVQPVCLPVVGDQPVCCAFRYGVGAAGAEGGLLICRLAFGVSEAFTGAGAVKADGLNQKT
jgi:hypothetical protein